MSRAAKTARYTTIAYNSCRNRHCPKCQGAAAKQWLAERQADLLPVPYYHVVFTLPAPIADIAYQNKAVVYDLLFKASAETMLTIAGDPKHLGARIGITSVLHTWGSALTHHPHVHMIVPGGGIALDGSCWVSCRSRFFLPWRVLCKTIPPADAGKAPRCPCRRSIAVLRRSRAISPSALAFTAFLTPLRKTRWYVYGKRPFAGPEAVLAYLSRYTHRVAIANSRLIALDKNTVSFKYKDYRARRLRSLQGNDARNQRVHPPLPHPRPAQGLPPHPPLRPVRQGQRADNIERARQLLGSQKSKTHAIPITMIDETPTLPYLPMLRRTHGHHRDLQRGSTPRYRPAAPIIAIRIDTS